MKPSNINFQPSYRKNKKYLVTFKYKGGSHGVHFGDERYEQYKDSTGLGLFTNLNHGDKKRRNLYLKRAKGIKDKSGKLTYKNPLSANYWSVRYLW